MLDFNHLPKEFLEQMIPPMTRLQDLLFSDRQTEETEETKGQTDVVNDVVI